MQIYKDGDTNVIVEEFLPIGEIVQAIAEIIEDDDIILHPSIEATIMNMSVTLTNDSIHDFLLSGSLS
jgi:hypothetical protein